MGVASGTGCSFRNMGGNRERRERDSLRSMGMETDRGSFRDRGSNRIRKRC